MGRLSVKAGARSSGTADLDNHGDSPCRRRWKGCSSSIQGLCLDYTYNYIELNPTLCSSIRTTHLWLFIVFVPSTRPMMLSASEAFERQEAYGSSRARQRDIVEDVAHDSAESPPPRHAQAQGLALEHVRSPSKQEHPDDSKLPLYPRGDELNARVWANHASQLLDVRGQEFQRVGLCLENLGVFGYGTSARFQQNVANIWLAIPGIVRRFIFGRAAESRVNILRRFDALIHPGEMCVVLGPPGSGCSTFLKTISGDTHGLDVSKDSYFNYHGISAEEMHNAHRGDVIYTAEADVHFPILTVGETLTFASHARCPMELPQGVTRDEYVVAKLDTSFHKL